MMGLYLSRFSVLSDFPAGVVLQAEQLTAEPQQLWRPVVHATDPFLPPRYLSYPISFCASVHGRRRERGPSIEVSRICVVNYFQRS
jgi:hypothetical protein